MGISLRTTLAVAAGLLLLSAAPLRAEDGWSLQAIATETGSYETNPLRLTHNVKPLYGSTTSPELQIRNETPIQQFLAGARIDINRFDQSTFDSEDLHGSLDFSRQMQRWSAGVSAHADYDTSRTSEISNFNLITKPVQHTGLQATPNLAFKITPVDKLALTGSVTSSHYDNRVFQDYITYAVSPSYIRDLDPNNAVLFRIDMQKYQTTRGAAVNVETVGSSIGWYGLLTPRLSGKANLGVQRYRQYGAGTVSRPWTWQYVFSGDLIFNGTKDTADLNFSRSQYPFSNGRQALLTSISLKDDHTLNDNFSVNLGGLYQSATYQSSATGSLDTLMGANGGLTYHATEHVDVGASYQYRRETLLGNTGKVEDHTMLINLTYRPKAWNL